MRFVQTTFLGPEAEAAQTYEMIKDEEDLLKEYDEKISWYQDANLKERRKAAEERLSNRRAMVSGLRRIPVEVWDEIFTLSCPTIIHGECDTQNYYPFHIPHKGPIQATAHTLSLTCAAWRKIVTSRPRLWSTISFDICHQCRQRDIRPLVQIYLKYSATTSLNISIWDARNELTFASVRAYCKGLDRKTVDAYCMILHNLPRCAKLELQVSAEALTTYVTGISHISLPRLHSFSHNVDDDEDPESARFWRAIRSAANLNCVYEYGFPGCFGMPPYNHALTSLKLGGLESLSRFRDILAGTPKLEQLALHITWEDGVPGSATVLDLPSLRHLRISSHYYPFNEWSFVLETLRMPALISFSVDHELDLDFDVQFPGHPYHMFRTGVTSPLYRCTRSLKFLTLECDAVSYEESEITTLAQNLPNLTHLRYTTFAPIVGISPCTAHLLASLQTAHINPSSSSFLDIPSPKLKWLEVRELNFRPRFVGELLERLVATAERRTQRSIASGCQSRNEVQLLSNIYVWWNGGGAEGEAGSGSEASGALGHVNLVNGLLLDKIKALEQDGIVCRVEERDIRPAWCEGFPSDSPNQRRM